MTRENTLNLQERTRKRANKTLCVTLVIVCVCLMVMFLGLYVLGETRLRQSLIIDIMIAVPAIISGIAYVRNPLSEKYRLVALISFYISYEVACLSTTIFLYNLFAFPIIIGLMMFFDSGLVAKTAIVNTLLTIFNGVYSIHVLGGDSISERMEVYTTWIIMFLLSISIYLATKVANVHNREEMEEMEEKKREQEEMMESIISIGQVINTSTQSINEVVGEVTEATAGVAIAMSDMAIGMESTVNSIQEQSAMTVKIQDVISDTAQIAEDLGTIAQTSGNNVEEGQKLVEAIVTQTGSIETESITVKENMQALYTHTKDMEKIIGMIQQISGQTNLLALNASIEAARAGEAGRGFAVVAEEIRVLSEQTKKSTQSIQEIIQKLNENATGTLKSMDHVMQEIGSQVGMIHDIEGNFGNIHAGLLELNGKVADMNEKTRQLRETNTVIVDNNNTLSSNSEEISAASEETAAMCAQNTEQFKTVNNVVQKLAEEAGKMNRYIEAYNALHEAEGAEEMEYRAVAV